jgi:diguanylate cyclase (GGDEF)-like protein
MFGYDAGELQHHASRLLFLTDDDHLRVATLGSAAIRAGESYRVQLPMRRKDGSAFWVDVSGMVMSATESLWMLVDIDKLKRSEESAQQQATRDALTDLPNRRMLEERLAETLLQARRHGDGFTLCYLDLDGFKPVNDRYGHDAGDEVLRQVARRLQELVRNKDVVARMGGDEFAILLPGLSRQQDAEQLLQRVLFSIQRRIQLDNGESVSVNASIGAVIGSGADQGRDLLRAADEVMYEAKRRGKGRIQVIQPAQLRAASEADARDWAAAA